MPFVPAAWSPDGQMLLFASQAKDFQEVAALDWLPDPTADASGAAGSPVRWRIWLFEPRTGRYRLLEEITGIVGAPVWRSDGESIVYARFDPEDPASLDAPKAKTSLPGMLRLIRRDRNGTVRSLHERDGTFAVERLLELPGRRSAWAPNGLWLAVGWIGDNVAGTLICDLRGQADATHLLAGSMPSWSPDSRSLALYQSAPAGFQVIPTGDWENGGLALALDRATQPVVWTKEGDAFLAVRPSTTPSRRRSEIEIVRVRVPGFAKWPIYRYGSRSGSDSQPAVCQFAYEPKDETMVVTVLKNQLLAASEWVDLGAEGHGRAWHPLVGAPFSAGMPLGAPAISAGGDWLAFRFGRPDRSAPLAVQETRSGRVLILEPDDSTRFHAILALVEATERLLRKPASKQPLTGRFRVQGLIRRPTPPLRPVTSPLDFFDLPARQALRDSALKIGIRRLTDHAIELLDATESRGASRRPRSRIAASRLFFRYVREEYAQALRAGDEIESTLRLGGSTESEQILATIILQCRLALGERGPLGRGIDELAKIRVQQLTPDEDVDSVLERFFADDATPSTTLTPSTTAAFRTLLGDPLLTRLRELYEAIDAED